VTSNRQRNDRKDKVRSKGLRPEGRSRASAGSITNPGQRRRADDADAEWLWGLHAVVAALENPARRRLKRLLATQDRAKALGELLDRDCAVEIMGASEIGHALPSGAVHQGLALRAPLLEPTDLEVLASPALGIILMLDHVTDPQNVGAIFRSAAAFGARGVIVQDRHAPPLTGALAKAAAGAVDRIPHARETNLSRALEKLDAMGWRAVGLDGAADATLADVLDGRPTVLVVGSEGEGLRRLVSEHCDILAKIPMPGGFESLNVSAAATVALYEASRRA
jgi:23S rRNA (guanosine2251-2'-O)-methyltransferase